MTSIDCRTQVWTLAAGESVRMDALNYLSPAAATGVIELIPAGKTSGIQLAARQVVGDESGPLGPVSLKNPGGASVTVTVITSTRAIAWNDPSSSATTITVGAAANGAAVSGNPVLHAGYDGTSARTVRTDSSGNQVVVGAAANGAAVSGNPALVAGYDGTNARTMRLDAAGAVTVGNSAKRTYLIPLRSVAPASANYYALTLHAGASAGFRLRHLWLVNPGAMTAAQLSQIDLVRQTTAATGGTTVTPAPSEASDAAFTGIARIGNATPGTLGAVLASWDVYTPAAVGAFTPIDLLASGDACKDVTVAAGAANGIAIRWNNGAAGAGSVCLLAELTEE